MFGSTCKHRGTDYDPITREIVCIFCKAVIKECCKTCGAELTDLLLLTSKVKYCKPCDSKKWADSQAAGKAMDDWEKTIDLEDLFNDLKIS